jgi:hypothetical protein
MRAITALIRAMMVLAFCFLGLVVSGCSSNLANPPQNLTLMDLVGKWTASYSPDKIDSINIDADGNFTQIYENTHIKYVFKSEKNQLALEKLTNGIIRLHLPGGRYYLEGISVAETNGRSVSNEPLGLKYSPFYDPFANTAVKMVDELILVVKVDTKGNLILHHMWTSSDRGFLIFNADREIFYRE